MTCSTLPRELVEFFKVPGNATLLVKGPAGAGKTLLSLELMRCLSTPEHALYVSTRVDPKAVVSQYPQLKGWLPPTSVVDATESLVRSQADLSTSIRYSNLPELLQFIYSEFERRGRSLFLVLDSIEAIEPAVKLPAERLLHHLSDFSRRTGMKTVVVTEVKGESKLDYLSDGVVELKQKIIDGRVFRIMELKKLRGIEVESPAKPFTLVGGRFSVVKPFKFPRFEEIARRASSTITLLSQREEGSSSVTSGIDSFDRVFGGYRPGQLITFTLGRHVPAGFLTIIVGMQILACYAKQRSMLMVPPRFAGPSFLLWLSRTLTGREDIEETVSFLPPEGTPEQYASLITSKLRSLRAHSSKPVVLVFPVDSLEMVFGVEGAIQVVCKVTSHIKESQDICLAFIHEFSKLKDQVSEVADRDYRVISYAGHIFVFREKPFTGAYSFSQDVSKEIIDIELKPIK